MLSLSACSSVPMRPPSACIYALMLPDARLAAEALGDDARFIMVAVAGQVDDLDPGVGNALADQALDLVGRHRHRP